MIVLSENQVMCVSPAMPGWRVLAWQDENGKPKPSASRIDGRPEPAWHEITHWGPLYNAPPPDRIISLTFNDLWPAVLLAGLLVPLGYAARVSAGETAGNEWIWQHKTDLDPLIRLDKIPHFVCVVGPDFTNDQALAKLEKMVEAATKPVPRWP